MFTLSSDKDQRKKALLLSVNESELTTTMKSTDKISMKLKRTGKVELLLLAKEGPQRPVHTVGFFPSVTAF